LSATLGGEMNLRLSSALLLTLAAFGGGSAFAAGSDTASYQFTPLNIPSLSSAAPLTTTTDRLAVQPDSLQRIVSAARISSDGSLNPVDNLDPVNLNGAQASDGYSGLYRSAALGNSPYALLTNGGNYLGSTFTLADNVHAHVGAFSIDANRPDFGASGFSYLDQVQGQQAFYEMGKSESGVAIVDWNFTSWGALGLMATQTSQSNGLLNGLDTDTLQVAKGAHTSTVGMTAHMGFGDGWVTTLSYNEGLTQLSLRPNIVGTASDALHSRAYGFSVAKHGLFGENDSLGLAMTRPLQVYSGGLDFGSETSDANLADIRLARQFSTLSSTTPETDFELGYVTTFMGGAIALQANAGYQMNVDGLGGNNALSVISRAKINF
jgi:hypothetical protein